MFNKEKSDKQVWKKTNWLTKCHKVKKIVFIDWRLLAGIRKHKVSKWGNDDDDYDDGGDDDDDDDDDDVDGSASCHL